MGTVSDPQGNIWIANCGNDSITKYPLGDPTRAINIPLGAVPPPGNPAIKPFAIAIDGKGNVLVTNNRGSSVSVLSPAGALIETIPGTYQGRTVFSHPIGSALDSKGNLWVANSDWLDAPCPTDNSLGTADNSSVTMLQAADRKPSPGSPYTGGGIKLLWGIAVDGDDMVWAFNFAAAPPPGLTITTPTAISRLCGVDTKKCPPGLKTGDPISPASGYQSDALTRITSGAIDPSGNIWLTGNWKIKVDPRRNPGQNSIAVAIGAAGPLKTPLRGPPSGFK
jgi:sugar lactone lactonase YvrE